jgi:NAD+ kinase
MIRTVFVLFKRLPVSLSGFSRARWVRDDQHHLKDSARVHRDALDKILAFLRRQPVCLKASDRVDKVAIARSDLLISVGGDGTFLELARATGSQLILGVNSDPVRSVGSFCAVSAASFKRFFAQLQQGRRKVTPLYRMTVSRNGRRIPIPILNDLLVTDQRPAAMSRYWLEIGRHGEEQRSSGLWISTAAGSTGAIRSAGGRIIPRESARIQYRPRELYKQGPLAVPRLTGELLPPGKTIRVGSLMRNGLLCFDGDHRQVPFKYGDQIEVTGGKFPLNCVT